jgi:hypothetical protein
VVFNKVDAATPGPREKARAGIRTLADLFSMDLTRRRLP